MKKGILLLEIIVTILATLLFVVVLTNFIMRPAQVKGHSMYPTLKDNERVITSVFSRLISKPNRFDIVVIRRENNDEWVKRVIALPNETIEIKNNTLLINDEVVEQPFLPKEVKTNDFSKITLKENEYFVMGDNREHSTDSRFLTQHITLNEIVAKHVFVYFPFQQIRRAK